MASSQDRSPDKLSTALSPKRSSQTPKYLPKHFLSVPLRCSSQPCPFQHLLPADRAECLLSGFLIHQAVLRLLRSAYLPPHQPREPLEGSHLISTKIPFRQLPPQILQSSSHQTFSSEYQSGTYPKPRRPRVPFHQSVSSGYTLPASSGTRYPLHDLPRSRSPDTNGRYSIAAEY